MRTVLLFVLSFLVAAVVDGAAYPPRPSIKLFQSVYYNPIRPPGRQLSFGSPLYTNDTVAATIAVNNLGMDTTGWNGVYVSITKTLLAKNDTALVGYFAAGYAEGYATALSIYHNWVDLQIAELWMNFTTYTNDWVITHIAYMRNGAAQNLADPYWQQVARRLAQLDGMVQGYNESPNAPVVLTFNDLFMINFDFEIFDVMAAMDYIHGVPTPPELLKKKRLHGRHCSSLIKNTGDNLFMAHNTWSSFETMLRQHKTYEFERTISMSSYPATIHSGDDFYMLNNGFTVQETTNDNHNPNSYKYVVPQSVSEFIRVMVANTLASSGKSWTETFCQENNGAYNNQFQILQMDKFVRNGTLPSGILWIVEQMPSKCIATDVTSVLNSTGYWASYNRPWTPEIFEYSGFAAMEAEYGNYFSYTQCPRARIFARNQSSVKSIDDMKALMRFCGFESDPLSRVDNCTGAPNGVCNPVWSATNVIAARGDLDPANGDWGHMTQFVGQENLAAIDTKIIAFTSYSAMTADLINGPTYDGVPPFQFSTSPFSTLPHLGIPDLVVYNWTRSNAIFTGAPTPTNPPPLPLADVEYFLAAVSEMSNARFHDLIETIVSGGNITITNADPIANNRTEFRFVFAGNGAELYASYLLNLPEAKLQQYGIFFLGASVATDTPVPVVETPAPTGETKHPYWIIGAVLGGVAVVGISVIFVRRGGRRSQYITVEDRDIRMV